jgi:hypothetical protein
MPLGDIDFSVDRVQRRYILRQNDRRLGFDALSSIAL